MRQLHLLWSRPAFLLQVTILAAAIILTGAGCTGDDSSQQAAQQGKGRPGAGGQSGQGPAQEATPVAMTPAVRGDIASYYRATASLEAEKEARILARVTGVVGQIFVEEGDEVSAGDPLLQVDNKEYRYRLQQAEATTGNLRSRYQRFEAMLAEDLTTEEEFQAARSDLANAEAEEGLARLNLSYTTVRAPFAGSITSRLVDLGQNLAVGNEVMVMADFHPLLARVHVPSREFNKLKQDQTVDLALDSSGEKLKGRIKLISPVIDPASGTIKVTVEVPEYPQGTRPGDFAEVNIVTELRRDTLLVPSGAVFMDKGESVVYVVSEGQPEAGSGMVAHRRPVTVGFTDDLHTEILEGLTDGDAVVTRGQRSLKDGAPVKILDTPS